MPCSRLLVPFGVAALLAVALVPTIAPRAALAGSVIRVTTTADNMFSDSRCSLREAIRSANLDRGIGGCNRGSGNDTILVPPGTIRLSLTGRDDNQGLWGDLDIWTNMTIRGSSYVATIVDGNQADRVFQILAGPHVTIDHLVVRGGTTSPLEDTGPRNAGGGISNYANLTLTNSVVTGNSTGPYGQGGGIFNSGMITIKDTWITDNSAEAGGGLFSSGSAYVIRTHVDSNGASGRMSTSPYVQDPDGADPRYIAGDAGGITSTGYLSVSRSVISDNSGGNEWGHGGIAMNRGIVSDTTIRDNSAAECGTGGVAMIRSQLIASTVTGNSNGDCGGAGGVYLVFGNIENSTISGNRSSGDVGGVRIQSGWIIQSTITLNHSGGGPNGFASAGGVQAFGGAIRGSIVAGNTGSTGSPDYTPLPDCVGTFDSRGHNLIGDMAGCGLAARDTDLLNVDPMLGPLANNGGPTMTHTLRPGSPAIDAWVDVSDVYQPPCDRYDQRGVHRPRDGNGDGVARCDIGALEWVR